MTHDQFEAHIQRITDFPIYGAGFRAGLIGRSTPTQPYAVRQDQVLWDDGCHAGVAEAAKKGESIAEWMSSTRRKVQR
jgi:ribosome modulation factor